MRGAGIAIGVLVGLIALAVLAPNLAPYDPLTTNPAESFHAPSSTHWFGTDQLGRDVFSRVLTATRIDVMIALAAVLISCLMGTLIGALMGYFPGWPDLIAGRFVDLMMAFPIYALAMVLVAALGNSLSNVICATAIVNLPFYIRLARAEVSVRRNLGYVDAARLGGSGHLRILRRFLIPEILPRVVVQASVNLGWAILNTAGLSFLGLGVRPPTPEWGVMVADGARYIASGQWWLFVFPGLALMATVFGFYLLGDLMRDALDTGEAYDL